MGVRATAIVPTLGRSRWLAPCLEALDTAGGGELEVLLVAQGRPGREAAEGISRLADRTLWLERNAGFAAANNLALAETESELVATVNDDVVVEPGWFRTLVEALDANRGAASAQGVNLALAEPRLADGCGLLWNRDWQAVQIAHGEPAPRSSDPAVEVFGVSATAAVYRRRSLAQVADPRFGGGLPVFDARLVSYYEDVDLACRLRAAGHGALLVPAARARHAGSASGRRLALGGRHLIYGNRHLVLARLLGRAYLSRLPRIGGRDAVDLARAVVRGRIREAAGIAAGWGRAAFLLRHYLHRGAPAIPIAELQRI